VEKLVSKFVDGFFEYLKTIGFWKATLLLVILVFAITLGIVMAHALAS